MYVYTSDVKYCYQTIQLAEVDLTTGSMVVGMSTAWAQFVAQVVCCFMGGAGLMENMDKILMHSQFIKYMDLKAESKKTDCFANMIMLLYAMMCK